MEDLPGKFKPNCLRFLHVSFYSTTSTAGSTNFENCSHVICWCFQEATSIIILSEIVTHTKFFLPLSLKMKNKIKTKDYPSWFRVSTIRKIWSCHVVPAKNGHETGTVEYSTELTFNSNLPNLIFLNVEFYMRLIWQFDSAHVKFDV